MNLKAYGGSNHQHDNHHLRKRGTKSAADWVGVFEAKAIAVQIETFKRPADDPRLLRNIIRTYRPRRQRIVYGDLEEKNLLVIHLKTPLGGGCDSCEPAMPLHSHANARANSVDEKGIDRQTVDLPTRTHRQRSSSNARALDPADLGK